MRLLLVSPCVPDPGASHGGGLYMGHLAGALASHAELGLVAFRPTGTDPDPNGKVAAWRFHATVPLPDRSTLRGGRKARHLLRMAWLWGPHGQPLVPAKHRDPDLRRALVQALVAFRPDAALVEFAPMAQYLPALSGIPTVFTDHEAGAPMDPVTDLGPWADRRDLQLWSRYVRRYYPMADRIQALTQEDVCKLRTELGLGVHRRPPVLAVPPRPVSPGHAPPRALFLGDYSHHPNPEAARVLALEVMPQVRRHMPEAELWLAGPNGDRIADLVGVPGVQVLGYVRDLPDLLGQVRLLLAPLYSGGGFRMKGFTALAHGLPVVTNKLGAQGAEVSPPARQVADTPEDLAACALLLLSSPQRAAEAGAQARQWAEANLTPDAVARQQVEDVEELLASRQRTSAPRIAAVRKE